MSGEDWSNYSSDDPEYEISDHSEMSDSDGSYSDTDDDEDIPTVSFNNWNVLSDPFADKIPRPFMQWLPFELPVIRIPDYLADGCDHYL
ncbi:hypothetical protein FQA39_LY11856 [Lamprigera yunnana]|nr:hypothetical protein FQA39_LY11856 [Lamprigera yunnana]